MSTAPTPAFHAPVYRIEDGNIPTDQCLFFHDHWERWVLGHYCEKTGNVSTDHGAINWRYFSHWMHAYSADEIEANERKCQCLDDGSKPTNQPIKQ